MDSEKFGKFISNLRKEKNMTQQELGDLLGINGKSVSKWERGINLPDISILNKIASIFEISTEELLNGERNNTINYDKDNNYFKKLFVLTIIVIIILVTVLFINNHYKYDVYRIESNDGYLNVDGYIILNPHDEIFLINFINYQNNSLIKTKQISFILKNDDKELFKYSTSKYDEEQDINVILKENIINIRKYNQNDNISNLYLIIEFNDEKIESSLRISEKLTNSFIK